MPLTKSDLIDFIAWLDTKPAQGTYEYSDNRHCLIAHYLTDRGHTNVSVTPSYFGTSLFSGDVPPVLDDIARGLPETYGSALERAVTYL